MIEKLTRKQVRYIMFRFKNEATSDGNTLRGPEAQKLLEGWGHEISKSKANGIMGDLKDAYESQEAFGGWENFAGPQNDASSWDIGMYNPNIDHRLNVALMISRSNKWFLFGIDMALCVHTRGYSERVSEGLDFFAPHGLSLTGKEVKEYRLKHGLRGSGRRRDPIHYDNDEREFAFEAIIEHALANETTHWPLTAAQAEQQAEPEPPTKKTKPKKTRTKK